MKISTMNFLTGRGIRNMGVHWAMTAACVGSLAVCLFLNGFVRLAEANVESLVEYLGDQNETVVWIDPECTDEETQAIGEKLAAMDGVSAVAYMSKDDLLGTYLGYMEEYAVLWEKFEEDNPLKSNYRVTISDLEDLSALSKKMERIPGVTKVTAPVELTNIFITVQDGVTKASNIFVIVLAAVSIITVGSTIRLSVYARRKEIEIMKYVGATNFFVCWPFFIEGVLLGLIAGGISAGALIGMYKLLLDAAAELTSFWATLFSIPLIPLASVWKTLLWTALASGALIGGLGSMFSIRKHLKV
jgi:cell division transport system permease protein